MDIHSDIQLNFEHAHQDEHLAERKFISVHLLSAIRYIIELRQGLAKIFGLDLLDKLISIRLWVFGSFQI